MTHNQRSLIDSLNDIVKVLTSEEIRVAPSLYKINRKQGIVKASTFALSLVDGFAEYLTSVSEKSLSTLSEVEKVCEYKCEYIKHILLWSSIKSPDVSQTWDALSNAKQIAEKDWLNDYNKLNCKGVILRFVYKGKSVDVLFNSPPFKQLKGSVWTFTGNKYKFTNDRLLVLPSEADALRVDERIFFLTERGARIFESPDDLASRLSKVIDEIVDTGMISDAKRFREFASDVSNLRRLRGFEDGGLDRLKLLSGHGEGKKIREKFGLKVDGKKLAVTSEEDVEKVIKLVCQRGMLNPFDGAPMEVHGASPWGGSNA